MSTMTREQYIASTSPTTRPVYDPDTGLFVRDEVVPAENPALTPLPNYTDTATRFPALTSPTPAFLSTTGSAADMGAALSRAQWDDYKTRFVPVENAMLASSGYMNPNIYNEQTQAGMKQAGAALDTVQRGLNVSRSRYGVALNPAQQAYSDRLNNINRSAAVVGAANNIRQRIASRDRMIALGG